MPPLIHKLIFDIMLAADMVDGWLVPLFVVLGAVVRNPSFLGKTPVKGGREIDSMVPHSRKSDVPRFIKNLP